MIRFGSNLKEIGGVTDGEALREDASENTVSPPEHRKCMRALGLRLDVVRVVSAQARHVRQRDKISPVSVHGSCGTPVTLNFDVDCASGFLPLDCVVDGSPAPLWLIRPRFLNFFEVINRPRVSLGSGQDYSEARKFQF